MKDGISAGESARMKKLIRRFAASFVLPLSSVLLLALAFCGCRTSAPPMPLREMVQELPSQILLRLQVLALRETVNASDGAPFPALGFQFAGDRVVPVEKPDTIAGVELTAPQLARWVANLDKAGATLYAAPGFTAGPNLSASSNYSTEKQYQANWRLDTRGATMQNAAVTPESKFSVRPELIPGTRDLLTSAGIEIRTADLDSFTLVDRFVGNDEKPVPLALLLPRQAILRIATQTLVRPGRTLVFAHYVKQYRSAPQPLKAAENLRDQIFFLLSAERRGPEQAESDLPIIPQIPPRFALSLIWLEAEKPPPAAPRPARANPAPGPAPDDLDELQKAAAQIKDSPDAVMQTLSLALTVKTPAQFEVADERGYVAGIHRDSDETIEPVQLPDPADLGRREALGAARSDAAGRVGGREPAPGRSAPIRQRHRQASLAAPRRDREGSERISLPGRRPGRGRLRRGPAPSAGPDPAASADLARERHLHLAERAAPPGGGDPERAACAGRGASAARRRARRNGPSLTQEVLDAILARLRRGPDRRRRRLPGAPGAPEGQGAQRRPPAGSSWRSRS